MADLAALPSSTTPPAHRTAMRRTHRSNSQSPSRHRRGDPLLSRLSPGSALEALRTPSGTLKTCLDKASISEQHFAIRTAIASKKILDWLEELSEWHWPKGSTSAGFEMPPAQRKQPHEFGGPKTEGGLKQAQDLTAKSEMPYLGSLPADNVVRYEYRISQIQKGMDELDLEEIKSQVLHNHIMPLSWPGTPFSDAGRSTTGLASFTKMEDITAVITAITIQALPNLSKLSKLLNCWSIRIIVLRKIPAVLDMIADAEVALESGWIAIKPETDSMNNSSETSNVLKISRQDFEVMNTVLRQKVAQPGRDLDYMLDVLEGVADTLPDGWLDRMDAVEKDYVDWAATAERRVREGEWSTAHQSKESKVAQIGPQTPRPKIQIQFPSPSRNRDGHGETVELQKGDDVRILVEEPHKDIPGSTSQILNPSGHAAHHRDIDPGVIHEDTSLDSDGTNDELSFDTEHDNSGFVPRDSRGIQEQDGSIDINDGQGTKFALPEFDRNAKAIMSPVTLAPSPQLHRKVMPDTEGEYSFLESVDEEEEDDEPRLPPARFEHRLGSHASRASTVVNDPASTLGHSDNGPFRDGSIEPELPHLPDPDEPFSSDALSPPSSPPLRYKTRATSVSFNDVPEISELPEEEEDAVTPPKSPLQPPEYFDPEDSFDYGTHAGSPGQHSVVSEGDDLHQQIQAVLKSIPNKIRLTTKPSAINLNPPDLQLPSKPKPKPSDPFRRSGSALSTRSTMSSRAGTPSWLLAPARPPRPQSRTSQDVKTYYLSRSPNEAPMKLLVRCVGENGERVMVRVGGGWADLGEYLKEYAAHHGRRSKGESKVEVKDSTAMNSSRIGSSPSSRPGSALDSPVTPLVVRKTRKSLSEEGSSRLPATPMNQTGHTAETPSSDTSSGSGSAYVASNPNSSFLGLSGPHPKKTRALSEESRQWVEDIKHKVRSASGEQRHALEQAQSDGKFGEIGKVGGTKRLFRKNMA